MVTIHILVEGGIGENDPQLYNPKMLNDQTTLRQAFAKLFEKMVGQRAKPILIPLGPVGNEKKVNNFNLDFYWRDLDQPSTQKTTVLQNVMQNIPSLNRRQIFFFVQEIEAWILSQLDMLNLPQYTITAGILQHSTLRTYNHPEDVENPADKLTTVAHIFKSEKGKPDDRSRYGKLKNAYRFTQALNVEQVQRDFEDVRLFASLFKTPQQSSS